MKSIIFILLFMFSAPIWADVNIFACEPEWAALSKELGAEKVTVFNATTGLQDPHYVQARPSLIAKARQADLLVCTGAELETGWLPLLQRKAGNAAIQTGAEGYFMAADQVTLAEKPAVLDRSQGHIHAAGNPHIQTSPVLILQVAEALSRRLMQIDEANAAFYQSRWQDFEQRWLTAIQNWQQQAAPLKDAPIVVQHKNWIYLTDWLGLKQVAVLEAKPGVPPTVNDLQNVVNQLEQTPAKMVILAAYQSSRASDWLVDKTGINKVVLPFTVGGNKQSKDLFSLFDNTIQLLLDGAS
ncbi:metal ABC transporter substrate-binding protein [Methylophaga sp. OBS4]|uniref:metal ABC transporter substrate-binding protein n=1 Tax=Methylophaga sp. OBS4 TaxID=2991935 RepID=UPI00224CBAC4|nr:zinc ABC transporter substrate-binding protein [Methylophaga sp. OBS4]MCX4188534.1 zinc ABC transporter substrate-binding protein [Methylophaga sp. OBS4]